MQLDPYSSAVEAVLDVQLLLDEKEEERVRVRSGRREQNVGHDVQRVQHFAHFVHTLVLDQHLRELF